MNPAPSGDGNSPPILRARADGFSLVELIIGIALFTVAFMGLGALFVMNNRSSVLAVEETIAANAFRTMAERIRSTPFENVAATYQGHSFTVADLDGTGTVEVFVDETTSSAEGDELGLPRDLDGDGAATSVNVGGDYQLLPIRIEVAWVNDDGPQTRSLSLLLTAED